MNKIRLAACLLLAAAGGCDGKQSAKAPDPKPAAQVAAKPAAPVVKEDPDLAKVPMTIRAMLNAKYAGWKLPVANEVVRAEDCFGAKETPFAPSVVWGDLDNNGSRDYAVQFEQGGATHVDAFLANKDGGFEEREITQESYDWIDISPKGSEFWENEKKVRGGYPADTVEGVMCGKSSTAYVHRRGKFREVMTSD